MKNIVINSINSEKIANTKLSNENLGKGKLVKTIDKILIGAATVFETLRELPGFEYLKSISIANLTTKFNVWLTTVFPQEIPNLEGLTAEEIYELGKSVKMEEVNDIANTLGILFSAVLEFVISHPTVAVIGVTTITSALFFPFSVMIDKINEMKEKKSTHLIK